MKFVKHTLKICFDYRGNPHIALLKIQMIPLGQELLSPATMLFNHLIRGIMPIINRPLVGIDNDEEHHEAIIKRQSKIAKTDNSKIVFLSP